MFLFLTFNKKMFPGKTSFDVRCVQFQIMGKTTTKFGEASSLEAKENVSMRRASIPV